MGHYRKYSLPGFDIMMMVNSKQRVYLAIKISYLTWINRKINLRKLSRNLDTNVRRASMAYKSCPLSH